MKEQPIMPENPDKDLFEWAKKTNPQKSEPKPEKDDLGWDCPQCELNNGWCERHPYVEKNIVDIKTHELLQEDIESSDRLVDREVEIERMEKALQEPATEEDIQKFLEDIKNKLAS